MTRRTFVSIGRNGASRVPADAREALERTDVGRQTATMFCEDDPSETVEVQGAAVVAKSAPGPQNVTNRGLRKRAQRRKAGQEARPCLLHAGDLCLLEHDLGDQDGIGIPGRSKAQTPAAAVIPAQDRPVKLGEVGFENAGFGKPSRNGIHESPAASCGSSRA